MTVLPFRRPKKKRAKPRAAPTLPATVPENADPERCPGCGWKLPAAMSADPARAGRLPGDTFVLYVTCPECGAQLVVPVAFR